MKIKFELEILVGHASYPELEAIRMELRKSMNEFVFRTIDNSMQDTAAHRNVTIAGNISLQDE